MEETIEMTEEQFQKAVAKGKRVQREPGPDAQRMQDLVDGKIPPPNPIVVYFLEKFNEGKAEFQKTRTVIQQLNEQITKVQRRLIQIEGEQNQRLADIQKWWDKEFEIPEKENEK